LASFLIFFKEVTMATQSQRQTNGLYELTDAARAELVDSKYFNEDLAPTSVSERTWTTYNISMLWVGMSICIPSFMMASGLVGMGLSVWAAVLNVVLGNVLILIPIQLNSKAGTKYGIPFPVFARMSFGMKGAQLPALSRAITAAGWCAVQSAVGGSAVFMILNLFGVQDVKGGWIGFIIFLILSWALTAFGEKVIRIFEAIGSPILIVMSVALFIWALLIGGDAGFSFGDIVTANISAGDVAAGGGFLLVFLAGLTGNIGFWATMALNIPDFSRYAKSQKAQFRGQLYGMPLAMAGCAIIGAVYAQATFLAKIAPAVDEAGAVVEGKFQALFSPVDAIGFIGGTGAGHAILVVVLALGVIIATLTTNIAANIVAPGNAFSNLAPRKISYFWGVTIACIVAIGYNFLQVGAAAGNMFNFLNVYGGILAPLAAIFVIDFWITKKQKLDVQSLYLKGIESRYYYVGGFNINAFIAWVAGAIIPTVYSIVAIGNPESAFVQNGVLTFINANAYIFAFVVSAIVYLLIAKSGAAAQKAILTDDDVAALEA
jgi:NCS1 family nucleobase:cation symporter-1